MPFSKTKIDHIITNICISVASILSLRLFTWSISHRNYSFSSSSVHAFCLVLSCLLLHPVLYCTVVICIRKVELSSKLHILVRFRDRTPVLFSLTVMSKKRNDEIYFRIVQNLFKTFDKNRPSRNGRRSEGGLCNITILLSDGVYSIEMSYSVDWFMIATFGSNSFESMKISIEIKENNYHHLFAYEFYHFIPGWKEIPTRLLLSL